MDINIESSCRVCLQFADLQVTIFEMQYNGEKLDKILRLLYPIEIYENDFLPQKICSVCQSNTITAYKQYKLCLETDKNLRIMINDEKEPSENEDTKINIHEENFVITQFLETKCEPEEEEIFEEIERKIKKPRRIPEVNDSTQEEEKIKKKVPQKSTNKNYICKFCNKLFITPSKLKRHLNIHVKEEMTKAEMDKLVIKVEDYEKITGQKLIDKDDKEPIERDKNGRPKKYICKVCCKAFSKPSSLKKHMNVHDSNKNSFECVRCHERFSTLSCLLRHDVMHTDLVKLSTTKLDVEIKRICMICQQEFNSLESYKSHLRDHKEEMGNIQFGCDLCPKQYNKISDLVRHLKTHKENKDLQCNICNKLFASGNKLVDHLNFHKGVKPHICTVCNKSYQFLSNLNDHMRTHSEEKSFLCSDCGKAFAKNAHLKQHIFLCHSGIKPYSCELCPATFKCKGKLKSHVFSHTKLKPHVCDICGSRFTKNYSMVKHKRLHTGIKPYSCEVCDMKFTGLGHVKRHMRIHTGERPYECKYCDRTFVQSNDLVKHTRSHVGEKTYMCEFENCGEAFRLQLELKDHMCLHYKKQLESGQRMSNPTKAVDLRSINETKSQTVTQKSKNVPTAAASNFTDQFKFF